MYLNALLVLFIRTHIPLKVISSRYAHVNLSARTKLCWMRTKKLPPLGEKGTGLKKKERDKKVASDATSLSHGTGYRGL